jgi:hypothetical protein
MNCPYCKSSKVQSRGQKHGKRKYQCNNCHKYFTETKENIPEEHSTYEQDDNSIHIVCASRRMRSVEDVLTEFKVDRNMWKVDRFKIHPSEGYRKDRKVEWKVVNGVVEYGNVDDTGKMLIVPLYSFEVTLVRKTDEIRARLIVSDILDDVKNYSPKYPKINYPKKTGNMLYEIDMPDIHFGRLTWDEESGNNYDIKIAEKMVVGVLSELLTYTNLFPIKRILLPIGNDFFNVNSKSNTTVGGTPQQEDTRWAKTFRRGWLLAVQMIEMCSQVAPVDVVVIKGNHDEEKTFYLGETLFSWFRNNCNVTIDNKASSRKYYRYGANLLGFTHGSNEKLDKLASLMPTEVPDDWAKSKFREWHLGHKHKKYETNEENGVVIRLLRSLVPIDAWTYDMGFVGAQRAAESFVWDYEHGLRAQFTASPKAIQQEK